MGKREFRELFNMTCRHTFDWTFGTTRIFFTNLIPFGAELQMTVTQILVEVLAQLHFEYSPENNVYSFFWS